MPYTITHKRSYDNDFLALPKDLQRRATQALCDLEETPTTPRGDTIKKLRGWKDLWRYRLDDYRLIYCVPPQQPIVQLLAIGPRKDVYQRFLYDPEPTETPDLSSYSDLVDAGPTPDAPDWQKHPEWFQPKSTANRSTPLPRKLTPALLDQWCIPHEFHPPLMRCLSDEDLIKACIPDHILGRIMDILWPAEIDHIADQPDQLLFRPQDLERFAEGTLLGFLLKLDDQQSKLASWSLAGPTLLKGGPGSGKSTVALYRARAIIENASSAKKPIPSILFTTYTNSLVNFSESLLTQLLSDLNVMAYGGLPKSIRVTTVDKVAMQINGAARQKEEVAGPFGADGPKLAKDTDRLGALHVARAALRPQAFGDRDRLRLSQALQTMRDEYLLEEFDWIIEGQGLRSEEAYLVANRDGRGIRLDGSARHAVWQLHQAYREHIENQGLLTWGQLRSNALDQVRGGHFPQRWDHVIVDEAQDLTPTALALCVELCASPSGLFLTADANQTLYNRGFRWRNVHDQLRVTGRTRILRRNYRSTSEIAAAARDLLTDSQSSDDEALDQEFVHRGRPPAIHGADGVVGQAKWLAEQIFMAAKELRLPASAAAVLIPSKALGPPVAQALTDLGLPAQFMESKDVRLEARCVKVMTLHAAKGLEFPVVAIAHLEADRLPRQPNIIDQDELAEHLERERQLLYVGCTRAMRNRFLTYDRVVPSPFLGLLSGRRWVRI
jgi:superfamily I DNA/RNA helicase/mRNA-degrading endonuclease RelE of RelBE toxin-antitoxin system